MLHAPMNPADSFIIKRANRNRSLLRRTLQLALPRLFLLLLDFLDPLLMVALLGVILGLLPGQLQHGCLLGGKKARLIRIYANHLSARGGDETGGRL